MSRWIQQTRFHEHELGGDCTETALACLLGIPRSEVPDFPKGENAEQAIAFEAFVNSLGYEVLRSYSNPSQGRGASIYDGFYLASGPTTRYNGSVKHMVVMRGGALYHDPHPSGEGLTSVTSTLALIPYDPSLGKP